MKLRPYQQRAVDRIAVAVARKERIALQSPTGSGKTLIGASATRAELERGGRVVFVVPRISLIEQTVEQYRRAGITNLRILQSANTTGPEDAPLVIASIDTLVSRKLFPEASLVFIDEAHTTRDHAYEYMARLPDAAFIGLTATPYHGPMFEPGRFTLTYRVTTMRELQRAGFLVPTRVFGPSNPDLTSVSLTKFGDFEDGAAARVMSTPEIVGGIIENYKARGENRPGIAFCSTVEHAEMMKSQFREAGIPSECIIGDTPLPERARIRRMLESGEIKILTSVAALTEGFDVPCVSCIIYARPTMSKARFVQAIGRGLRISPETGKKDCIVFDHTGTTARLGFVEKIDETATAKTVAAEKATKRQSAKWKPDGKWCPACSAFHGLDALVCELCGTEFPCPVIEHKDAIIELAPSAPINPPPAIYPARQDRPREAPEYRTTYVKPPPHEWPSDDDLYAQLKHIAAKRDYPHKWVLAAYRDATGRNFDWELECRTKGRTVTPWKVVKDFIAERGRAYRWRKQHEAALTHRELAL